MNTTSLRKYVYDETAKIISPPLTHKDTAAFIDIVFEGISLALAEDRLSDEDKRVLIRSFGKFVRVTRKGRVYNVHGRKIAVPDRKTVIFKPGKRLMRHILGENISSPGVDID